MKYILKLLPFLVCMAGITLGTNAVLSEFANIIRSPIATADIEYRLLSITAWFGFGSVTWILAVIKCYTNLKDALEPKLCTKCTCKACRKN